MAKRYDHKSKLFFVDLDTNECTEGKHDCDVNAECNNTLASYKCTCKDGYEGNGTNCTGQSEAKVPNNVFTIQKKLTVKPIDVYLAASDKKRSIVSV